MPKLWEPNPDYDPSRPQAWGNMPYKRLYRELTPEQLSELLRDAEAQQWKVLDLSNTNISEVPESITRLSSLQTLDLGFTQIREVPETIGNLSSLQELDLRDTNISTVPETIGNLSSLKALDLSRTNISAVPETITRLSSLQMLYLGYTKISEVPETITRLSSLQTLYLYNTPIREVPETIGNLSSLKALNLSNTQIRAVPETITRLSSLQMLYLGYTKISEVPETITRLSSLQSLDLYNTQIREVPETIGKLKNLSRLDLCNCHLKAIPYALVTLGLPFVIDDKYSIQNSINLTGVELDEGDLQLFAQPRDVIEAYYRGQTQTLRECKVIFLGDGAVGKTSLIERIVNGTFTPGTPPTDGIEVTKWYMSVKATEWETTVDDAPFTVRFLDFGGQEIMHAAHRCFLTAHTVYVVVCDSRDDEKIDDIASYWLESVKAFAPDCPVILALNKADLNPNASVNERDLRERNPALKRVLRTSAALKPDDDYGVSELIRAIRKQIPGAVNQYKVNVDMLRVKQALEDMRQQEGTGYITSERYREICNGNHITDKKLQYSLLGFFRDLGVAYYYETPSLDTRLESVRVLNPEWLTNGIYRLILRTREDGFLQHAEIKETLRATHAGDVHREITYTPEETEYILHVMRCFEISHDIGGGVEMIPLKMQKTPPESVEQFRTADALHLRWEGMYLPSNLIHRLLIRKFPELDIACVWRTGGHFRRGDCEALAQMNEKALDVYVTPGRDCRQYMETFRVEIQDILSKLNLKEVSEIICHTVNGREGRVSYQAALSHLYHRKEEIYLANIDAFVSPVDLLKEIYVDVERELKRYRMEWERGYRDTRPTESPVDKELQQLERDKQETEVLLQKEELAGKRQENKWKHMLYVGILGVFLGVGLTLLIVAANFPDKFPEIWNLITDILPGG